MFVANFGHVGHCRRELAPELTTAALLASRTTPMSIYSRLYCGPVLRHSAGLIQAANFQSVVVF